MRRPLFSRKTPYSEILSPRFIPISRMRMLCCLEPVKYARAAPKHSGSITRRSTWSPSRCRMAAFVVPRSSTSATWRKPVKALMTAAGSVEIASRSMSPTVSFMRRSEPASVTVLTPRTASSAWTSSRPRGSARPSGIRA